MLPNQWSMVRRLRTIPDTVDDFTGYALAVDLVAWDLPGAGTRYQAQGGARVRNVELPADVFACLRARRPRTWRATRRCAPGSTPTSRVSARRRRRRAAPPTTACGPPTCGSTSRSTGCSRPRRWCAPGASWRCAARPSKPRVSSRSATRAARPACAAPQAVSPRSTRRCHDSAARWRQPNGIDDRALVRMPGVPRGAWHGQARRATGQALATARIPASTRQGPARPCHNRHSLTIQTTGEPDHVVATAEDRPGRGGPGARAGPGPGLPDQADPADRALCAGRHHRHRGAHRRAEA